MDQRATRHQPRFPLRVGVLSAAGIMHKSWPALHQAGHSVTWIGCRDVERGQKLATEVMDKIAKVSTEPVSHAPRITDDYEQVVSAVDVDVVYMPLPTALRDYWVHRCVEHGKHVVGEKPAAANAKQVYEWLSLMAPRRLLYMDGTMFSHGQRVRCVEAALQKLGPLHHIDVNFSFLASADFLVKDIRTHTGLEPQGALGDLGWYAVRWIQHLVQFALPSHVSARILATTPSTLPTPAPLTAPPAAAPADGASAAPPPAQSASTPATEETGGAITAFEGHLTFPAPATPGAQPITATFFCSFNAGYEQSVRAYARDGTVVVNGAINPTAESAPGFTIERMHWTFDETKGKRPLEMDVDIEEGVVRPLPSIGVAKTIGESAAAVDDQACEEDSAYQIVQLWRDVGDALIRLGRDEPILIHPERGKHWTTMAYLTQYILDQLLSAAETGAAAIDADEKRRAAETEAVRRRQEAQLAQADEAAAAAVQTTAKNSDAGPTNSPRGGSVKAGGADESFPFALF